MKIFSPQVFTKTGEVIVGNYEIVSRKEPRRKCQVTQRYFIKVEDHSSTFIIEIFILKNNI